MNIKTEIASYLLADATISGKTTQIFRKRVKKWLTTSPYIVYRMGNVTNKRWHYYKQHWYRGYELIFDIVWPYEQEADIDIIAERVEALLWWFQGTIWSRTGSIAFVEREEWWDEKSDFSIVRCTFLVKEIF